MPDKKNCFIIMPITTPEDWLSKYRGDKLHFHHVLDCLFLPAIEQADFNAIKPIAEGADNIPAEIIKNLDNVDLVLCDLSVFNSNVFFELGIRTALNKPVCLVRDEFAPRIPFDVSIINCYQYKSALQDWDMKIEKENLANHIKASLSRSQGKNPLWKYFGIRTKAMVPEENSMDERFNLMFNMFEHLSNRIESTRQMAAGPFPVRVKDENKDSFSSIDFFNEQLKLNIIEYSSKFLNKYADSIVLIDFNPSAKMLLVGSSNIKDGNKFKSDIAELERSLWSKFDHEIRVSSGQI